ncbi:leucine-rich repeat-containing protein 14-like [Amphiura filiformis]|uniref:leucine-rich repeat-containing protein 14-like n=1 Tax=Amphiura filiformis TaxID=82378 RepID=UPI003B216CA1
MDSMKASIFSDKGYGQLPSLVNICIKSILMDHGRTKCALQLIPKDLYERFLVSALRHERQLCIMEIVAQWPYRVLNLRSLMPKVSDAQCRVCTWDHRSQIAFIRSLCLMIAAGFREQIRRNGKLQVLDISDLAYSITGMGIKRVSDEEFVTHFLNMFGNRHSNTTSQQSGHNRVIYMDWVVGRKNKKLVLSFLKSGSTGMSVRCRSLSLQYISENSINQILARIDPQTVNSLNFRTRDMFHNGLKLLERLTNLSSLDLSYTFYDILNYEPSRWSNIYAELGSTFSKLPNLIHLNLEGNRLSNQLRTLLQRIQKQLSTLQVDFCQLNELDISYLANSLHAKQLQNLSIGSNNLSKDPESLFKLLTSCGETLQYCCLSATSVDKIEAVANRLAQVSHRMKQLCTLRLSGVQLSIPDQAEIVTCFGLNVPTLKFLHMPLHTIRDEDDCENAGYTIVRARKCIEVQARLPFSANFNDAGIDEFFDICVKRFCDSEPHEIERELHVLARKGPQLASPINECCFLFKF